MMDSIAEGFSAQARNIPNLSPGQRRVSGFLTGFGAGMKGVADQQRASKLAAMEEASRQLAEADINLRFQDTALNATRAQAAKFTLSHKPEFLAYAQALKAGDTRAANDILKLIASDAVNELDGFKQKYGEFDHTINGKLFFTKNGQTMGYGQKELFSQLPFVEVYGDDARELDIILSNYQNQKFEQSDYLDTLGIRKQEADIANTKAHTDVYGAQADLYRAQANTKEVNPEEYKNNAQIAKFNRELIRDEVNPKLDSSKKVLNTLESLQEILEESPNIVGSDFKTAVYRKFASQFGLDPNIDYARLESVEFEKMLKPILGAQLGEKEGERVLSKFPSISVHPAALKAYLKEEIPRLSEDIIRNQRMISAFNKNQAANVYDSSLSQDLDKEAASFLDQRKQGRQKKRTSADIDANSASDDELWDIISK